MIVEDTLYGDDFEDLEEDGDFVVGDADEQNIECIMLSAPGHFRKYPILGFNSTNYLNAPANLQNQFTRELKVHLEDIDGKISEQNGFPGIKVKSVKFPDGFNKVDIDWKRE